MKGRTMPRRYRADGSEQVRRTWNGKLPEEFEEKDTLAFMAETDVLVHGEVAEETLEAIRQAGYAYESGMVVKPSICGELKKTAEDMPGCEVLEYRSRMIEKKTGAEQGGHPPNRPGKGER
ncbi:MAG: hypothetical protein NC548_30520 [Lachnospiraceae bacterium]|nr:hypothetical protein [Acetatifactor muris]MCM1218841.1 hypothetical protein [Lachnospiraceae bacterium]